jgi:hypothetical protein
MSYDRVSVTLLAPEWEAILRGLAAAGYDHMHRTLTYALTHPQPSEPDAKQVGTSPEHANETPESWHVPDILDLEGYRADPHYDNGGSPQ